MVNGDNVDAPVGYNTRRWRRLGCVVVSLAAASNKRSQSKNRPQDYLLPHEKPLTTLKRRFRQFTGAEPAME